MSVLLQTLLVLGLTEASAQMIEVASGCPLMVRSCLQAATRNTGATTSITGQANQPVCEQVGFCAADECLPTLSEALVTVVRPMFSATQPLQLQGVRGHVQHRHTHAVLSICDLQKFYTKIEDRPQVREVVTTFKEHHPIQKVR